MNLLTGASLLALAKSIYYPSLNKNKNVKMQEMIPPQKNGKWNKGDFCLIGIGCLIL